MGFGTGLNAILTYSFALEHNINVRYSTIEKYPVSKEELEVLDYQSLLHFNTNESIAFNKMHHSPQILDQELSNNFCFNKTHADIKDIDLESNKYDIIYFDAFAPQHQPDLWNKNVLQKMFNSLKPNGFLITYCAQGQFKRTLKSLGFKTKALPGPPGKREITKAIKST
jgi:tRNA U34 5-methylaminomethyl-2-thiouridine-forming methyltransferase MnmC